MILWKGKGLMLREKSWGLNTINMICSIYWRKSQQQKQQHVAIVEDFNKTDEKLICSFDWGISETNTNDLILLLDL